MSIWYAAATIVIALAGLGLLVWGWRHDPARGRRRCPKCWYDMAGAEAGDTGAFTCPECGRAASTVRALQRPRRSRVRLALGVLAVLSALVIPAEQAIINGTWPRYLPTTALYAMSATPQTLGGGNIRTALAGDEIARRRAAGEPVRPRHLRALLAREALVSTPSAWPRDEALPVRVRVPFPDATIVRTTDEPRSGGVPTVTVLLGEPTGARGRVERWFMLDPAQADGAASTQDPAGETPWPATLRLVVMGDAEEPLLTLDIPVGTRPTASFNEVPSYDLLVWSASGMPVTPPPPAAPATPDDPGDPGEPGDAGDGAADAGDPRAPSAAP